MESSGWDGENRRARPPGMVAPAPVAADVAIAAALAIEVADVIDRLSAVKRYLSASLPVIEGELKGKIVVVGVCGVGRQAARKGTEILLAGHRPQWVISAGFAGALNQALARNDAVLADVVTDLEGLCVPVDVPVEILAGFRGRRGRLLTVDRLVANVAEKRELAQNHAADLVDMESSAVAQACRERSVRFLSARIVSDDAHADLPPEIAELLAKSGSYRVGAALRALWRRPASLKDFWRVHEHALEAGDRLARLVTHCVERLPR